MCGTLKNDKVFGRNQGADTSNPFRDVCGGVDLGLKKLSQKW